MPIRFVCEHCGQLLSVGRRKAGSSAECPKCKAPLTVPQPQSADSQVGGVEPAEDPYSQFAVYDDQIELVYEECDQSSAPAVNWSKVAVPRAVIYLQGVLLIVTALACFVLGLYVGRGLSSRSGAERPSASRPCLLTGEVVYQRRQQGLFPDEGAVVVAVPQQTRPDEKAPAAGLRPDAPQPADQDAGLNAIRLIGGAYGRADAQGRFRLRLPSGGEFFVLILSANQRRSEREQPSAQQMAQLGRYFTPGAELVGRNCFEWRSQTIRADTSIRVEFD